MREMTLDEIKRCSFEALVYFDKVCRDNNLQYFLCAGTMLGSVRHQGFIPWDDDIDVMMPREDFERLLDVWPGNERYDLLNHKNTRNLPYAYSKLIDKRTVKIEPIRKSCRLIGVDIDVFPIDSLPDDEKEAEAFYEEIRIIQRKLHRHISQFGKESGFFMTVKHNISVFLVRLGEAVSGNSVDKITGQFDALAQKYNSAPTSYCGITAIAHYGVKEWNPKTNYSHPVPVEFEGGEFPAPCGYEDYLTRLYGKDYMQLPPEEARITHHTYRAYWK